MKQEDLEKQLYNKSSETEFKERKIGGLNSKKQEDLVRGGWNEIDEREKKTESLKSLFGFFKKVAVVFLVIVTVAVVVWFFLNQPTNEEQFVLQFIGPASVKAGDFKKVDLVYRNKSGVDIKDAKIFLKLPPLAELRSGPQASFSKEGIYYRFDIGTVMKKTEGRLSVEIRFWGENDMDQAVEAKMSYRPSDSASFFDVVDILTTKIEGSVFSIVISGAPNAVNGESTDLLIEYTNEGNSNLDNLIIQVSYPDGFLYETSDKNPSISDNTWELGTLGVGDMGKISIKGLITGFDGEVKRISAYLGAKQDAKIVKYAKTETRLTVSSAILSVYQTVNESRNYVANFGDTLNFRIQYKNMTNAPISNVIIRVKLEGRLQELDELKVFYGAYDVERDEIIWNSAGVPALSVLGPKEEGEVSFSVRAKKEKNINPIDFSEKNYKITSTAIIDSPSIPTSLGGVAVSIKDVVEVLSNTSIKVYSRGYYFEGPFVNTGPIPPKVGEKTTYTIEWQATNVSNDVSGARVEAFLPLYMKWMENTTPLEEKIYFDPNSGKIVWDLGKVSAGTGFYLPARKAAFQVYFVPAPSFFGAKPKILEEAIFSAQDDYTNSNIKFTQTALSTDLSMFDSQFTTQSWGKVER